MSRILFLVSSMQGGGAERVAALLCNQWVQQGHAVTLMPTFSGRGDCLYPLDERVKLDYLADRVGSTRRSVLNKIKRLFALRRAMREISPDVVVSFLPPVNVAAILSAAGLEIPVIVSERTYPPAMPLGTVMEQARKWLYPHARTVVVQTQQASGWLAATCPSANGMVIPNPVVWPLPVGEPEVMPVQIVAKSRKLLLAVGRLGEEKEFHHLLSAFKLCAEIRPDWDLVILGEGNERAGLEALRSELGLDGRVHLPGRVGNLADWYERADLYVMSSRFEGFPNTLLEAMAHGLPVVSFDCDSGPRYIIRHDTDGLLVAPESGIKGLAASLSWLMDDKERREAMGQRAVDVRERFSMARVSALWTAVLGLDCS
ncbi:MAG: glycosyltransferase family 4 protein [Gammaproteobacteria bacterium]|nr:glycosyltransferase family 4 protein [Gammaproteobacteria bacterium]